MIISGSNREIYLKMYNKVISIREAVHQASLAGHHRPIVFGQ